MQINTREAMRRAVRLRQKLGSWEEVERAGNATKYSLEVLLGGPIDEPSPPSNPASE